MTRIYAVARERADLGTALVGAAMMVALLAGVAIATDPSRGLALVIAVVYFPLVFVNLPLAVCAWIPVVFLEDIPMLNLASKGAGALLVLGWAGALLSGAAARRVLARHRRVLEALGLLVIWLTLSLAWAPNTAQGFTAVWQWGAVALVFLIVATSITSEKMLTLAIAAYVVGAVLAVMLTAAKGNLRNADEAARLEGAVGDPNFLAAALVSAIPLAFALMSVWPRPDVRLLCLGAVALLTTGVVASQSRGGMAAALAMWVAAVVVLPHRRQVLALGAVALAAVAVAFAMNPGSWERVTSDDSRGSGRLDIWTVAWHIFEDHPVHGSGVNNFARVATRYVRDVGPLEDTGVVIRSPTREVHNSYLQFLAENGIVSLLLFAAVAVGCLRAGLKAARLFTAVGRPDLAAVAHGACVGSIGLLASYFFISGAVDRRLWILLGLSLAALEVASRMSTAREGGVSAHATPALGEAGAR